MPDLTAPDRAVFHLLEAASILVANHTPGRDRMKVSPARYAGPEVIERAVRLGFLRPAQRDGGDPAGLHVITEAGWGWMAERMGLTAAAEPPPIIAR